MVVHWRNRARAQRTNAQAARRPGSAGNRGQRPEFDGKAQQGERMPQFENSSSGWWRNQRENAHSPSNSSNSSGCSGVSMTSGKVGCTLPPQLAGLIGRKSIENKEIPSSSQLEQKCEVVLPRKLSVNYLFAQQQEYEQRTNSLRCHLTVSFFDIATKSVRLESAFHSTARKVSSDRYILEHVLAVQTIPIQTGLVSLSCFCEDVNRRSECQTEFDLSKASLNASVLVGSRSFVGGRIAFSRQHVNDLWEMRQVFYEFTLHSSRPGSPSTHTSISEVETTTEDEEDEDLETESGNEEDLDEVVDCCEVVETRMKEKLPLAHQTEEKQFEIKETVGIQQGQELHQLEASSLPASCPSPPIGSSFHSGLAPTFPHLSHNVMPPNMPTMYPANTAPVVHPPSGPVMPPPYFIAPGAPPGHMHHPHVVQFHPMMHMPMPMMHSHLGFPSHGPGLDPMVAHTMGGSPMGPLQMVAYEEEDDQEDGYTGNSRIDRIFEAIPDEETTVLDLLLQSEFDTDWFRQLISEELQSNFDEECVEFVDWLISSLGGSIAVLMTKRNCSELLKDLVQACNERQQQEILGHIEISLPILLNDLVSSQLLRELVNVFQSSVVKDLFSRCVSLDPLVGLNSSRSVGVLVELGTASGDAWYQDLVQSRLLESKESVVWHLCNKHSHLVVLDLLKRDGKSSFADWLGHKVCDFNLGYVLSYNSFGALVLREIVDLANDSVVQGLFGLVNKVGLLTLASHVPGNQIVLSFLERESTVSAVSDAMFSLCPPQKQPDSRFLACFFDFAGTRVLLKSLEKDQRLKLVKTRTESLRPYFDGLPSNHPCKPEWENLFRG